MKFSKVEVGEKYYFDILGKTDKYETYTVTVIKKRLFPKKKIIVKSNQTNDVFNCNSKYLVPIYSSDISGYNCIIRNINNIIDIDEVDYEILKTIKLLLSDNEDFDKIKDGLDILLIKMSMIVKNNNSCDILKNLKHKNFQYETNISKFSEEEYSVPESVNKKFEIFSNELINHLNSNDESFDVYEYFKDFPNEILFLKELSNGKKLIDKIDYTDIVKIANQVYDVLSDSNKVVFIPYYLDNNKSVLVFDSTSSIDYIINKFDSILKKTKYIINYAMQIICLEKNDSDNREENDYE